MKRNWSIFAILTLVAMFGLAGCGSSDDDNNTTEDTTVEEDNTVETDLAETDLVETDLVETDLVETDLVEDDMVEDDTVVATGACTNDADLGILATDRPNVEAKAQECGLGCLNDTDPVACSVPCITEVYALTDECAACYGATIACTIERCVAECIADPAAEPCTTCQVEKGCIDEFLTCSGLE